MAGSFRVAEGYVEVTADESNYDRAMARLTSKKHQVKVGVHLDDKDALAQLARIAKNRVIKIDVNLAGVAALTKLARDARDRRIRIAVDLNTAPAMEQLARLTRDRVVKVKVDLDQTAMARLTGRTYTAGVIAQINDAAYQRVKKALDKLTADRVVQIRATADTRVAADELRNLVQRQKVRIGVDVDTHVAADSLANLTRRRTMTVGVNANTTDARARLDALTRDRHMNVRVDMDRSALSSLSSLGSAGGGGSALGGLTGSLSSLTAAAIGALPTIASLGQSLIAMAPASALAAPAVLGLASAFAVVKLGMSGIGDAFKTAFAPAASSASTALSATKAVENAQRSLAKAQQGVKDAEVNAAAARVAAARQVADAQQNLKNTVSDVADSNRRAVESVTRAERDLADAQRAEKQAQEDLTQARKDAKQELEDLNNQLADAHLNERDDILAVQDAQQNLDAVKAKGAAATQEEKDKAQLEYDKAVQSLKEQQTATARLEEQTAAANAAGVDGSAKVTAAEQAAADAKQNTTDKTQALKDAQIEAARTQVDGAQKIAKAQRDVADAQAAATKATTDGARSIADAQQAVADAARAVADAQESASLKTDKLGQAMARLSPQARAFVNAVIAQGAAWRGLKLDVQDALFRGLGGTFTRLSVAVVPSLRAGLSGTASVLNSMAKNAAAAVTNLAKTGTLRQMFSGLNNGLKPLARFPGQFITGLTQISVAASPAFARLTMAAGGAADRIAKKLGDAFKSGHMEKAINAAVGVAKQFGHLIGDIFGTLGNVMKAAAAGGGDALGALGAIFKELHKVTAMPEVQKGLASIFTAINTIAKLLAGTVGTLLVQLVSGFAKIAPAITSALGGLHDIGPLLGVILLRANPVLGVLALIAPILGKLAAPIAQLVKSIAPMLQMLASFSSGIMTSLAPVIGSLIGVLSGVFQAVAPIMGKVAPMLLLVVKSLAGPLSDVIRSLIPLIGPVLGITGALSMALLPLVPSVLKLLPPVGQLIVALSNLALQVLTPLLPLINLLAAGLADVLAGAIGLLVPVITTVIGWITTFVNAVSAGVKLVVAGFQWMYDVLVGHSIIPDLVTAIISWFTSLWTKAKQIFDGLRKDVVAIWNALWSRISSAWSSFWNGYRNSLSAAGTAMRNAFSSIRSAISNTWSGLWNGVRSTFSSIIGAVQSKISSFASSAKTAFSNLRNSLSTIWNGIRSAFSNPVKFVINTVYNNGIRKMWDTIASKVGLPQLPTIKLAFAKGGIIPGTGNKDNVPLWATPGERMLSLKQVAKLGGHRVIDAMVGRSDNDGSHFAGGGIIGSIESGLGSAWDWTKDIALGGLQSAAKAAIEHLVRPLINRIPTGNTGVGQLLKAVPNKALDGILSYLGDKDKKATTEGQINYKAGAGVAQWAPQISQALSLLGQSASWLGTVERRMNQESGGNPNIVNKWDSNWTAGHPSVGLMQVIGPTFKAHAGPYAGTGPFSYGTSVNPLANIFAGLHYAIGRYGSLSALNRPGGYDSGGLLQPGATLAVNRTGRPERVLDADHTAKLDALLSNPSSGGVTVQSIQINGTFDFSSPASRKQAANAMVAEMKEALRNFDKDRR